MQRTQRALVLATVLLVLSGTISAGVALAAEPGHDPITSLYLDLDPQPGIGYEISLPPGADWHTRSSAPEDDIVGEGLPDGAASPSGFFITDQRWGVRFFDSGAPVAPGTYAVPEPIEEVSCGEVCVQVSGENGSDCWGAGTFTIHEIAFTPAGELETLAADFRLTCFAYVMAGSLRYASDMEIVALDQDADVLSFGDADLGEASANQTVTYTNFGTVSTVLGSATLTGDAAADFDIVSDDCASETLSVGESCEVAVRFQPSTRGNRFAALSIPDETSRESRLVRLRGSAWQPTSLDLTAVTVPEFGPAPATFDVTLTPNGPGIPRLFVDGAQQFGPTESVLTNPPRLRHRYTLTMPPGSHEVSATFEGQDFMLSSEATSLDVNIATATALTLSTATDDGVAVGESAELVAQLAAGGPVGGTLRIRDATDAIVASKQVSGSNASLSHTVTRGEGTHTFTAEFDPATALMQAASAEYDLVVVAGSRPQTIMDASTLYSNGFTVLGEFSTPTAGATLECRYGGSNVWFACASPYTFTQNNLGTHQIVVRAVLANGLADRTPASRSWIIETTPPTASAPTRSVASGTTISAGAVPLRLAWSGADATSGVKRYELEQSTDGGAWTSVSTNLTSPAISRAVAPQHGYRFRILAVDGAGNESPWATGSAFTLSRFSEASSRITYQGTWRTSTGASYWGSAAKYASTTGARASFTFTGKTFAWVARRGPTRGKAEILVNGSKVATVDLYASAYQNQRIVWTKSWSTATKRTVTIRVLGTSGRPRVDLDAIVTTN